MFQHLKNSLFGSDPKFYGRYEGVIGMLGAIHSNLAYDGSIKTAEHVTVENSCKLTGDIQVASLKADSLNISGIFKADEAYAKSSSLMGTLDIKKLGSGSINLDGTLRVHTLTINQLNGQGTVIAAEVKVSESIVFKGILKSETIDTNTLDLTGNVTAKELKCSTGSITLDGKDSSRLDKLQAEHITIKSTSRTAYLHAKHIEGHKLVLENVKAEKVIGQQVTIGANCEIDELCVSGESVIHPSALVKVRV